MSATRNQQRRRRSDASPRSAARRGDVEQHHYMDDVACPACGTDSTAGCFAEAPVDHPETPAIDPTDH